MCRSHSESSCKSNIDRWVVVYQIQSGFEDSIPNPLRTRSGPIRTALDVDPVRSWISETQIRSTSDVTKLDNDGILNPSAYILIPLLLISAPKNISNRDFESNRTKIPLHSNLSSLTLFEFSSQPLKSWQTLTSVEFQSEYSDLVQV